MISVTTKLGLFQNIVSQLCCRRNRFRCVGASFLLYWQKIWINRDWITKFEKNPNAGSADRPLSRNAVFEDSGTHRPTPRASWAQLLHSHHLRHQANPTSYKKNHVQIFFEDTISVIPKQWVLSTVKSSLKCIKISLLWNILIKCFKIQVSIGTFQCLTVKFYNEEMEEIHGKRGKSKGYDPPCFARYTDIWNTHSCPP